ELTLRSCAGAPAHRCRHRQLLRLLRTALTHALEENGAFNRARRRLPIVAVDIHHPSMRATRATELQRDRRLGQPASSAACAATHSSIPRLESLNTRPCIEVLAPIFRILKCG